MTFPQSDENLIERFLTKTRNTLKEIENVSNSTINFETYLTNKIKKYGIHYLNDISMLNQIGQLTFNENLFDNLQTAKVNMLEDESTGSFSNNQMPNETQTLSEIEKNFGKSPIKTQNKKEITTPVVLEEEDEAFNEEDFDDKNDFFDFKMEKSTSPIPNKNKTDENNNICIKLESKFKDVSSSSIKKQNKSYFRDSKPEKKNVKIARYALLVFFILMFFVIIKMFIGINNTEIMMVNNSVRHVSNRRNQSKFIL